MIIEATQQYVFPVVLFTMLYKVILTFLYVDNIVWCDHLNDSISFALFFTMKIWAYFKMV